jgi:hypothetical protein
LCGFVEAEELSRPCLGVFLPAQSQGFKIDRAGLLWMRGRLAIRWLSAHQLKEGELDSMAMMSLVLPKCQSYRIAVKRLQDGEETTDTTTLSLLSLSLEDQRRR